MPGAVPGTGHWVVTNSFQVSNFTPGNFDQLAFPSPKAVEYE